MKVLLVSTGSGSQGGGEFYLLVLARALAEQGHEVHLGIPDHPRMEALKSRAEPICSVHSISVVNTYDRRFRSLSAAVDRRSRAAFGFLFKQVSPDVIHINQQVLEDGLDVLLAADAARAPFVITTHITHEAAHLGARFGWLRDRVSEALMKHLSCPVITVSETASQVLVQRMGKEENIRVVYNGVESFPAISPTQRQDLRESWGVQDDSCVIGVVGRIEEQKNPLFFVRLLQALRRAGYLFKAAWIGDGRLRSELESAAESAGISDRLHIDGWRDDVRQRIQGFDLFVLTSEFEGLPFALQEAMLAGLPACVTDADGMREAVLDGKSGFLCPAENLEIWVDRVGQLVSDAGLRRAMGKCARTIAEQRFTTAAMAHGTLAVYRAAIDSYGVGD